MKGGKDSKNYAFKAVRDAVDVGQITIEEGNSMIIKQQKKESKILLKDIRLSSKDFKSLVGKVKTRQSK